MWETNVPLVAACGEHFDDIVEKSGDILYFRKQKHLSCLMGKPTICICETKGADQLPGNREADQRLCFRYSDSTVSLLLKSEISRF